MSPLASLFTAATLRFPKTMDFLRQPTTITGLATIVGTLAGVGAGSLTPVQAVAPVAFATVAILIPERPGAATAAAQLAADAILLASPASRAAGAKALAADAAKEASAYATKAELPAAQ